MATKMAANFVAAWRSCGAAEEGGYSKSCAYSNILNTLSSSSSEDSRCVILRGNSRELSNCRVGDADLCVLVKALLADGKVRELDLSYNSISDPGLGTLCTYLKDPSCTLLRLDLGHNDFTEHGADLLANALQFNSSLTSLSLDGCKIGAKGGIHIAAMLQVNRTLTHLGLAYTDIDTDCIIAMATVLHGNQTLRTVDLSRPLLHSRLEESTIHISRMLQVNSTLKELKLSLHSMTDTGCEWLCRHLLDNTSLTHLDLSNNKLSRDGGRHFARLLRANTPLTSLNLSCNNIDDHGLTDISSALLVNTSLTCLNVCYNKAGDEGLCQLARCLLNHNTTLARLYIWGNLLGAPTCDAFRELLESCRLHPDNTDVQSYIVDNVTHLSRTHHQSH